MASGPGLNDQAINARLNFLKARLARLQISSAPSTALRTDGQQTSSASRILSEERRRNNLLQQLREEYSKARNAVAAPMPVAPPYYFPPQPPTYASEPREKSSRLTEIMEAMMLQNAQVFQMMQQQMLMNSAQTTTNGDISYTPPPVTLPPLPPQMPPGPKDLPPLKPPEFRPLRDMRRYPFPGPRKFGKITLCASIVDELFNVKFTFFIESLRAVFTKGKKIGTGKLHIPDDFLIDLYLREIISACHTIYLDVRGPIYRLLDDFVIRGNYDYNLLITIPKTLPVAEEKRFYEGLAYLLETMTYYITDIMPNKGVLGTHRKSALFEIMREYRLFPKKYFYDPERQVMTFDERGRTIRVNDGQAMMLLIGAFFVRALATTLMLRPLKYRLLVNRLIIDQVVDTNLRFVATLFVFLYRAVMRDAQKRIMPFPKELTNDLYTDGEILPAVQRLKPSFDKCERYITQWAQEYVRRLRAAAFTNPSASRFDRNFYRRAAMQPAQDHIEAPAYDRTNPKARVRPPEMPPYPRNFNSVVVRPSQYPSGELPNK